MATLIVTVVMVAGSIVFSAVLGASVHAAAERAAEARAEEISTAIERDGADVAGLDDLVQIVDDAGRVVATSDEADEGALPIVESGSVITYDGDPVLVVREELDGDRELLLGVAVDDDAETLGTVAGLLAVSTAIVVVLVASVTWWVVGRALRPVSRIRSEVDEISADRLDARVVVPGSGDEIAALAETMNRMLERLDAGARAQRRFVSDASHELRSPLATIRQHAELARDHPDASSLEDLAEVVSAEGVRMQDLVDALLLLARLDEHAPQRRDAVDLDDLALAEVTRLRAAGISVDGSGIGAGRVAGDGRMLGRLVRNLADNARRHARSRVSIGVTSASGRVTLTVDDDGTGVPPDERERVFERFVRLDDARARDAGGSGLGLAIVRGIVEASGGTVTVTQAPLGGARFTVVLPAAS